MFTVILSRFEVNNNFKYCVVVVRPSLINIFHVIEYSTIAVQDMNNGSLHPNLPYLHPYILKVEAVLRLRTE